jgi:hypothetical protein
MADAAERERLREEQQEGWYADSMAVEWSSGEESLAVPDDGAVMKMSSSSASLLMLPGGGNGVMGTDARLHGGHFDSSYDGVLYDVDEDDEDEDDDEDGVNGNGNGGRRLRGGRQPQSLLDGSRGGGGSDGGGGNLAEEEFMALSDVATGGGGWMHLQQVVGVTGTSSHGHSHGNMVLNAAGIGAGVGASGGMGDGGGGDGTEESDDTRSIATSLFVEVSQEAVRGS